MSKSLRLLAMAAVLSIVAAVPASAQTWIRKGAKPGETVDANGVLIYGALDIASTVPTHASQMFGRNVLTLLQHLMKDRAITIDLADEIAGPMCVVYQGQPRTP